MPAHRAPASGLFVPVEEAQPQPRPHAVLKGGGARILRALTARNYRLFFTGQGISLLGSMLQQIALGWYVYRLTGSQILLGMIGCLNQIPGIVVAPIMGALCDRVDCKRALFVVQSGLMLQSFCLATVVSTGHGSVPLLLSLAAAQGVLNACDLPIRQAIVPELVEEREALPSAIALNSALFNVARILGPSVGGLLVALFGEVACFFANAASYLAVLLAIAAMSPLRSVRKPRGPSLVAEMAVDIGEALDYVRRSRPIRDLLVFLAFENFLGLSYIVLFPVLARDVLHGTPHTLGLLMGAAGIGSLAAALRLASRRNLRGLLGSISHCALLSSSALALFGLVRSLPLMMLLIAVAGFGFISVSGACNTIIHTLVEDRLRGRVLSFYSLAFIGTTPLGNLALARLSQAYGITRAIACFGSLLFLFALVFRARLRSLRATVRPIYVDLGIIPWKD